MSDAPVGQMTTGDGDAALDSRLGAELSAHNLAASGVGDQRELTVRVDDPHGELLAGLSGWTWGTCAGIGMVWVQPDCRDQGWGGRLLEEAEREARRRGCSRIFVSSFTFQAPVYYEKHGYREQVRIENYPLDGAADVYLVKHLV